MQTPTPDPKEQQQGDEKEAPHKALLSRAVALKLAEMRQTLVQQRAALAQIKDTVEGSLRDLGLAERTMRGAGLREASLLAAQGSDELVGLRQHQSEANDAFRLLQARLHEISQLIESIGSKLADTEATIAEVSKDD